jgi:hypothetical protein
MKISPLPIMRLAAIIFYVNQAMGDASLLVCWTNPRP